MLALAENDALPLRERVKFTGIMGMIYREFAMKRLGGLNVSKDMHGNLRQWLAQQMPVALQDIDEVLGLMGAHEILSFQANC